MLGERVNRITSHRRISHFKCDFHVIIRIFFLTYRRIIHSSFKLVSVAFVVVVIIGASVWVEWWVVSDSISTVLLCYSDSCCFSLDDVIIVVVCCLFTM